MDIVPILSTIILIATIITLIIAIAAYVVFRVKERARGRAKATDVVITTLPDKEQVEATLTSDTDGEEEEEEIVDEELDDDVPEVTTTVISSRKEPIVTKQVDN